MKSPEEVFGRPHYQRHNARRLEHLASLRLPIAGRSALELGAGIGDHTGFFLDRGCSVTAVEARRENLLVLEKRRAEMPKSVRTRLQLVKGDLEEPETIRVPEHDVVYSYGLLCHLENAERALHWHADKARELLLLETCVSFGDKEAAQRVAEDRRQPSQSLRGGGFRPTRPWVFNRLKQRFPYVYVPRTQPAHEEFPLSWLSQRGWGQPCPRNIHCLANGA